MADLLDSIRSELHAHLEELRPLIDEQRRIEAARQALGAPEDMDQALELLREPECVEVTPDAVRLRKIGLTATDRVKQARTARND